VTDIAALVGFVALLAYVFIYMALGAATFLPSILIDATGALALVLVLALNRSKRNLPASILLNFSISLPIFLNEKLFFGPASGYHYILILCVLLPTITIATRKWWIPFGIALMDVAFFFLNFKTPPLIDLTSHLPHVALSGMSDTSQLFTIVGAVFTVSFYQFALTHSESDLEAKSVVLRESLEEVHRLANQDNLTGLMNRRHLEARGQLEIERARRYGLRFSGIMFDLDRFKDVNDHFGHEEGDRVLQRASAIATLHVRSSDLVGRWGGDEFLVLLPQTDLDGATVSAENLRKAMNDVQERERMTTGSFGVAEWLPEESFAAFFGRLDGALYSAKYGGRNHVAFSEDGSRKPRPVAHIDWNGAWDSGDPMIDRQHRRLLDIANEIVSLSLTGTQREQALGLLEELLREIREHFDYEESVLEHVHYSGIDEHRRLHRLLLNRALELRGSVLRGESQTIAVFVFVLDVIVVGHIQDEDTGYFDELRDGKKK